jgi:uncharacterized protein (DUF2336 family)
MAASRGVDLIAKDVGKLVELARDSSSEGRANLLTAISGLVEDSGRVLTSSEKSLMNDILKKLIQDVAKPVRKALAEKLAHSYQVPQEALALLANDEYDIASPILLKSPLLSDDDLIFVIRHRSHNHRLAVAMRSSLTTPVSDALVSTNSVDIIKTLLENRGAEIAHTTMAYLVEQSRTVDEFREPLLRRQDLEPALAKKMYVWVSAALRQYIVEHYPVDKVELDNLLAKVVDDVMAADSHGNEDKAAMQLARQLAEGEDALPDLLVKTLRRGEITLFECLLAHCLELDTHTLRKLVHPDAGEGLVIASRVAGLSRSDLATIFLLFQRVRPANLAANPYQLSRILEMFDSLKPETARDFIKSFKNNPDLHKAVRFLEWKS